MSERRSWVDSQAECRQCGHWETHHVGGSGRCPVVDYGGECQCQGFVAPQSPSADEWLGGALRQVLTRLRQAEDIARGEARRQGIEPERMLTVSGEPILAPILTAQAQALAALVALGEAAR